jgi:hypothetical protein
MSKKLIEEAITSLGEVDDMYKKQVEFQKNHYFDLIDRMEDYQWRDLLKPTGVKIGDKEGDPQAFVSQITSPVKLGVFVLDKEDPLSGKVTYKTKVLPCLLELKLRELKIYMGPIGQKLSVGEGKEPIANPIILYFDKKEKTVRFVCL